MQFKRLETGMCLQMRVRRTALPAAPVASWVLAVAALAGVIGCGKQDSTPPAATDGTTAGGAADTAVSGADVVADAGAGVDQGTAIADGAADSDAGQAESEPEIAVANETVTAADSGPDLDSVGGPEQDVGVFPSDADVVLTGDDTVEVSSADVADAAGDVVTIDAKVDVAPPPECALPTDCSAVLGPSPDPCKGPVCAAGKCGWAALPVGATCDTDGLTCTGEKCAADGQCEFGGLIAGWCGILQDGKSLCVAAGGLNLKNPCEVCDPAADLTKWSLLDDGTKCGPTAKGCVTQTCKGGVCAKVPDFSLCAAVTGGADCKYPSCDPSFGCLALNTPATSACIGADGLPCTLEKCDGKGNCVATGETEVALCADGVTCTTDECSPTQGCVHTANPKSCNDGNACTVDACDTAKGGCTNAPEDGKCDDGTECTYLDLCENGSCIGKEPQVWSTVLKTTEATVFDLVERSNGIFAAGISGNQNLTVSHLDLSGKFVWEAKVDNAKWQQAGLVNLEDGGVAVVGDSAP